jgi:hypothetical protein
LSHLLGGVLALGQAGAWGVGHCWTEDSIRIWSQANFGEDLIYGPRGGAIYYWDATGGVASRGVLLSSLAGATDVPTHQNLILTSDISRFVFAFGANEYGSGTVDPMLIRWSEPRGRYKLDARRD